jgi:hypothetical protein
MGLSYYVIVSVLLLIQDDISAAVKVEGSIPNGVTGSFQ